MNITTEHFTTDKFDKFESLLQAVNEDTGENRYIFKFDNNKIIILLPEELEKMMKEIELRLSMNAFRNALGKI